MFIIELILGTHTVFTHEDKSIFFSVGKLFTIKKHTFLSDIVEKSTSMDCRSPISARIGLKKTNSATFDCKGIGMQYLHMSIHKPISFKIIVFPPQLGPVSARP
jgi:hypothetical protein